MTKDPVCGMPLEPAKAAGQIVHAGKTYHFCSTQCQRTFQADPQKYAEPSSRRNAAASKNGDQ